MSSLKCRGRVFFPIAITQKKKSLKYEPDSLNKFYAPGGKLAANHGASPSKSLILKSLISLKIL